MVTGYRAVRSQLRGNSTFPLPVIPPASRESGLVRLIAIRQAYG